MLKKVQQKQWQGVSDLLLALCGRRDVYFRHLDQRNDNFGNVKFLW
jgi:hypothetical protein